MDLSLDLKQDLEVVKAKLDSAVIDLWELKVQVQVVKKDYVIIAVVCRCSYWLSYEQTLEVVNCMQCSFCWS